MTNKIEIGVMIITVFVFGMALGYSLPWKNSKPSKEYPIEVTCGYETDNYYYSKYMDADSVKGDTIWKDGNKIVNKNIINVTFK